MNPIRRILRIAGILAGLACAWIGLAAAAPAAFAMPLPPGGSGGGVTTPPPVQVHTVVAAGMTGWQIALIAIGAAPWRRPSRCCWTGRAPPAATRSPRALEPCAAASGTGHRCPAPAAQRFASPRSTTATPKARPTVCETGQTNKANLRPPRRARRALR